MPLVVLMGVRVVRDATDDHAREVSQGARRLHLKAQYTILICQLIPQGRILDNQLPRRNRPPVDNHIWTILVIIVVAIVVTLYPLGWIAFALSAREFRVLMDVVWMI